MSKPIDAWMPFYVADYLRDTGHLNPSQHGSYVLLLIQAWTRDGLLPDDDGQLRALARMDPRDWKRSRDVVMAFFYKAEGGYRHKRIEQERDEARTNNEQKRAAGIASAEARARQRAVNGSPTTVEIPLEEMATETPTEAQRKGRPSPVPKEESKPLVQTPNPHASPLFGLDLVRPCEKTGRPCCGGWYLDEAQERVFEAAKIDNATWRGNIRPLLEWLADGIEPDTIVEGIKGAAAWSGYKVPSSLKWFDTPVREAFGRVPDQQRRQSIAIAKRFTLPNGADIPIPVTFN